jgi:hypothetical protein
VWGLDFYWFCWTPAYLPCSLLGGERHMERRWSQPTHQPLVGPLADCKLLSDPRQKSLEVSSNQKNHPSEPSPHWQPAE